MILEIDYDTSRWVYVPREFPWEGYDAQEWAATVARIASEDFEYMPLEQEILERRLAKLLGLRRVDPLWERFVLLGVPDRTFELVQLSYAELTGEEGDLEELLATPDPQDTRDVEIVDFPAKLGPGLKAIRYFRAPELNGEVSVSLMWAWRARGRDIVLLFDTTNLVQFEAVHEHLDAFAASISLVDR